MTLQSNWRMGNTLSMSHPPVFVSEPNLTPSDKKLGRAALYVYISLVPSETITNYSLLITNCIFASSDKKFPVIRGHLRHQAHCPEWGCTPSTPPSVSISTWHQLYPLLTRNWVVVLGEFFFETTETTETKETTAKQSIIRMIINFSVISVVPTVSVISFLKKGAAF